MSQSSDKTDLSSKFIQSIHAAIILNADFYKDTQGGIETYGKELANVLERKGIQVLRIGICERQRERNGKEILVAGSRISNYLFIILLLRSLRRLPREDILLIHTQRPDQLLPFILLGRGRTALISTVHGPARMAVFRNKGRLTGLAYSVLETIGMWVADRILFVDRGTRDSYLRRNPWLEIKSDMIPPGISFDRELSNGEKEDLLRRCLLGKEDILISFVGRLDKEKNVDLILKALSIVSTKFEKLKLVIAGEGSEKMNLMKLSRDFGVADKTVFLGQLSHSEIKALLEVSRLLVLASKWEGSPLVVRESIAVGTPVVSPAVGDVPEIVKRFNAGIIVEGDDPSSLAEGIEVLLSDATLSSRTKAYEQLSWDGIAEEIIRSYHQAIKRIEKRKAGRSANA